MTSLANTAANDRATTRRGAARILPVRIWLFTLAALVFAMVVAGGATRLTGSGLSITEWRPILGAVPPMSEGVWEEAFAKYRQIPQYRLANPGMSLDAFKAIYWWEWAHRLLGRVIGAVFLIPFAFFLARGAIPRRFVAPVAALFALGAAQGALGWFMVKSGLADRVDVSQYRLAAHLALAVAIGGFAFWLGLAMRGPEETERANCSPASPAIRLGAGVLAALVYLQIIAGAFVAGLHGGLASNTWPLMNGELVPPGLDAFSPWPLNLFENPLAAQFAHRALAYAIAIFAALFAAAAWRSARARAIRLPLLALNAAVLAQIALGVATIILGVPLGLALAHQANAMLVFALALWTLRRTLRRSV